MLGFLVDFGNEFAEFFMPTVFSKSVIKAHLCSHFLAEKDWKVKRFLRALRVPHLVRFCDPVENFFQPLVGAGRGWGEVDLVFHIKGCSRLWVTGF